MVPISALLSSAPPQHPKHITFEGRQHYVWRRQTSPFPIDNKKYARLSALHNTVYVRALGDRLHTTALRYGREKVRILDVACGTGIWAMMAATENYNPRVEVVGIDIESVDPDWSLEEIREDGWELRYITPIDYNDFAWGNLHTGYFDFCHVSNLAIRVSDWEKLYGTIARYLKPGSGRIELVFVDWNPQADDASPLPLEASPLRWWWSDVVAAANSLGIKLAYRADTANLLQRAGFVEMRGQTLRIPLCDSQDPKDNRTAMWLRAAIGDPNCRPHETWSMSLFRQAFAETLDERFAPDRVRDACRRATQAVADGSEVQIHFNLHIWRARRP